MRKLTLCCFATTALLALPLSVQAAPTGAMPRAADLQSTPGESRVILVAEEQKPGDTAKPAGDTQPTGDKTTGDTKDTGGKKATTTTKKKTARHKKSQPSKKQVMQKIKQYQQYVPKEYQGYIQQGTGGAGGGGGNYGGYGGYTR
jgi:hypothetical protein